MISRRNFVRRASASAAVLAVSAVPALPAPNALSRVVNERFAAFMAIQTERQWISDEADRRIAQLPAWASYGPAYLNSEGELVGDSGDSCGWPVMKDPVPPESGKTQVRFYPPQLVRIWKDRVENTPDNAKRAIRKEAADFIRAYRARIRERDHLWTVSGITELEARFESLYDVKDAIHAEITAIEDCTGNADLIGARIVTRLETDHGLDRISSGAAELEATDLLHLAVLRSLEGQMTGAVGDAVGRFLRSLPA